MNKYRLFQQVFLLWFSVVRWTKKACDEAHKML